MASAFTDVAMSSGKRSDKRDGVLGLRYGRT